VPTPAITFVANRLYNEHYETSPMTYSWEDQAEILKTEYWLKKHKKGHSFSVESEKASFKIDANSEEEFITEHYWGYSQQSAVKTVEYEVTHPKWQLHPVTDFKIDFDFGVVHGANFKFLNNEKPSTVFLASGSEITIESKRGIQ
jgi:hypothetical protein